MLRNVTKLSAQHQSYFIKTTFKLFKLNQTGFSNGDKKPSGSPPKIMLKKSPQEKKPVTMQGGVKGQKEQRPMLKPIEQKPDTKDKKEKTPLIKGGIKKEEELEEIYPATSPFLTNTYFSKYTNYLKNYHRQSFENIYKMNLIKLTSNKIKELEKELRVLKEVNNRRQGDSKTQNLSIEKNKTGNRNKKNETSEISSEKTISPNDNDSIFQSKSIKELENKLKQVPVSTINELGFKYQVLNFYTEINIDKAFGFFYDNIMTEEAVLSPLSSSSLKKFLQRLVELDKTHYLNTVYNNYIVPNHLDLASLFTIQEFNFLFNNFFHYHMQSNFNYETSVLCFNLVLNYLTYSKNKHINFTFNVNFSEVFDKMSDAKFASRKVKSSNDEMVELIEMYVNLPAKDVTFRNNNQTIFSLKDESLAKFFTLTFDNSSIIKDEAQIFDLILKVSKKHANTNFIDILNENVTAYYQYFGYAPKVLSGHTLKSTYFSLRENLKQFPNPLVLSEKELEFFITLFKFNEMPEFVSDILNNWSKFSLTNISKSRSYSFALADYILSSSLEEGVYYHKHVENVYFKKAQPFESLVHRTLAYLKDGNKAHAVENFFKELEENMKNARENDKMLLDLYKKTFEEERERKGDNVAHSEFASSDIDNISRDESELEYLFNLEKVKALDSVKESLSKMFTYFKSFRSENKLQAQEHVMKIVKNISSPIKNNYFLENERLNIVSNVSKVNNANYEDFKAKNSVKVSEKDTSDLKEKLEDLYSRIKVELYLDNSKFALLSEVLEKEVSFIYDLQNLEYNHKEKEIMLDSLDKYIKSKDFYTGNRHRSFLSYVREYIGAKPVSHNRVVFLTEEAIRKTHDEASLFGYNKMEEYIEMAQKFFNFMAKKYNKNNTLSGVYSENLKHLEEIGVNLKKAMMNMQPKDSSAHIKHMETILSNYKKILVNLYGAWSEGNVDTGKSKLRPFRGRLFDNYMKMFILSQKDSLNDSKMVSFNRIGKNIAKLSERVVYHKLVTLNGLRDLRAKNIIKAVHHYNTKKIKPNTMADYINVSNSLPILHKSSKSLLFSTFSALSALDKDIIGQKEENLYTETLFSELCKAAKIEVPNAKEEVNISQTPETPRGKLAVMKELLNQDYEHFSIKLAVYMVLFGAENNLPEAIRMGEKVCNDYGFVLPTWVESRVNKYLVHHSADYAATVSMIGPVNVASVYRKDLGKDALFDTHGVQTKYDSYKAPSVWAIDYLPFKGLEEIVDLKKFTLLMRNFNGKGGSVLTNPNIKF